MARLIWSPQSAEDLDEICKFIAKDSEEYARMVARRIYAAARSAADFPQGGRVVPDFENPNLREKIVGNYRVVYRIHPGAVEIATVIHGARLLDKEALEDNP
jgi:plasmid stabilization system protein ParE